MIAADVVVQTNRAVDAEVRARVDAMLADAPVLERNRIDRDADDGAAPSEGRRGADGGAAGPCSAAFPFYGTLALADGRPPTRHDLLAGPRRARRPELLVQLGMKVGDRLIIGGQPFTIRGVIAQEPGRRVGAFSFGSRVMVDSRICRRRGCWRSAAARASSVLLQVRDDGSDG